MTRGWCVACLVEGVIADGFETEDGAERELHSRIADDPSEERLQVVRRNRFDAQGNWLEDVA